MVSTAHLFTQVSLTRDVGGHSAGDTGVLVDIDADGRGVVEFDDGRWLVMISATDAVPAAQAQTQMPAR